MTKKDLFDGLNYIDDQIIEEAQPTGESAGYSDEIYVKNHETHHGGKEDCNNKDCRHCGKRFCCPCKFFVLFPVFVFFSTVMKFM